LNSIKPKGDIQAASVSQSIAGIDAQQMVETFESRQLVCVDQGGDQPVEGES